MKRRFYAVERESDARFVYPHTGHREGNGRCALYFFASAAERDRWVAAPGRGREAVKAGHLIFDTANRMRDPEGATVRVWSVGHEAYIGWPHGGSMRWLT